MQGKSYSTMLWHSLPQVGSSAFLLCSRVKPWQEVFLQARCHQYPASQYSGIRRHTESPDIMRLTGLCSECQMTTQGYVGKPCLKRQGGAREMAWRLGALAVPPEDPGSIPRTHIVAYNFLWFHPGGQI
ncbi:hypothetical protein LEMLEM_LOCUS10310, partial [Lemmus lemmus]